MVAMVFFFGGMAWTAIGLGFYENCVVAPGLHERSA